MARDFAFYMRCRRGYLVSMRGRTLKMAAREVVTCAPYVFHMLMLMLRSSFGECTYFTLAADLNFYLFFSMETWWWRLYDVWMGLWWISVVFVYWLSGLGLMSSGWGEREWLRSWKFRHYQIWYSISLSGSWESWKNKYIKRKGLITTLLRTRLLKNGL